MINNEILRAIIEKSGLNQKDFAEKVKTDESRISEWIKNKRTPKLSTLEEFASVFGFEIKLIFSLKKAKK